MLANRFNKISILCWLNALLLAYTAWIKYSAGCPSCNQTNFLEATGVYIAILGVFISIGLAVLGNFASRSKSLRFIALALVTLCASFASYLQILQYFWASTLCYHCLAAAFIFYAIFCSMAFEIVIRPQFFTIKGESAA